MVQVNNNQLSTARDGSLKGTNQGNVSCLENLQEGDI